MSKTPASAFPAIEKRAFRDTLGRMPTGVTIVTTCDDTGNRAGATVGSFTSLSLDPPLVLFSLDHSANCHPQFRSCRYFSVNVLAEDQAELSNIFASKEERPWEDLPLIEGEHSPAPLLDGCVAYIECALEATHPGGDHEIFVGRVLRLWNAGLDRRPLLFFGGTYRRLDLDVVT